MTLNNGWRPISILAAGCLAGLFLRVGGTQARAVKPSPALQNLEAFLPIATELQGWKSEKTPQVYRGEDLYLYIDGGAEIYHEYGFKQVLVQDYKSASGKSLTLEIFEMVNSESAFGIYTFKSSGKGKAIAVGQDGQLEEYYLNFWKGSVLVTVTGFDSSPEVIQGLVLIAKSVDAKIKSRGERPALIEVLPADWFPLSRQKYIKGVLGLQNTEPFLTRSVFGFKEAAVGVNDEKKLRGFIFRYSSAEECRRKFREARAAFEKSADVKDIRNQKPDIFTLTDSQGRFLYVRTVEDCLTLIITKESLEFAAKILVVIRDNCAKLK